MRSTLTIGLVTTLLVTAGVGAPAAHDVQINCQKAIGATGKKFVHQRLELEEKCRLKALATVGGCVAPDPERVARLEAKLQASIAKQCTGVDLEELGFPGACSDTTGGAFVLEDLQGCISVSHGAAVASLADIEVDPDLPA